MSLPRKFQHTCFVLRPGDLSDCTNGGLSSRHTRIVIVGPDGPVAPTDLPEKLPVFVLVERNIGGQPYIHVEPEERPVDSHVGPMEGGNYVHSTDSRWRRLFPYPLPIHDRFEKG